MDNKFRYFAPWSIFHFEGYGTLWQVFIRVIDWIYSQSCGIFDLALRAVAPLAFSLLQLSPSLPPSEVYCIHVYGV